MGAPAAMSAPRRFAAWLVTGPLAFLAAGIVDWLALLGTYLWARARGREPWAN